MTDISTFMLFAYGTLRATEPVPAIIQGCVPIGTGSVPGTLYDIDGEYPALMLYGETRINGTVWRCPVTLLGRLDEYEAVDDGLFRRAATAVKMDDASEQPCWIYLAGPRLARLLTPDARMADGVWPRTILQQK